MTSGPNPSLPVTQLIGKKKEKEKKSNTISHFLWCVQSTPHLHHTLFLF